MSTELPHYLLPLQSKTNLLAKAEDEEIKRMQTILDIADETVKDIVLRGEARTKMFEEISRAAQTSRNVGVSDNTMRRNCGEGGHGQGDSSSSSSNNNILFSTQLSDPHVVARTPIDQELAVAVKALRDISKDTPASGASAASTAGGVSALHQRVAPLRSALSIALRERDPSNMRALANHVNNPRSVQRIANIKGAAVLFDALGKIQRDSLEPLEKKLTESPFVLPFHVPFVLVANHIRGELLAHRTGEQVEQDFNELFDAIDRELVEAYRALDPENRGDAGSSVSVPQLPSILSSSSSSYASRIPSAKECFVALLREMKERAALHESGEQLLAQAEEMERSGREFLAPTVGRCREQAMAALNDITRKSEELRGLAKQARELLEVSLGERVAEREQKIEKCTSAILQLEARALQNRNKQEKAVRRMREEIKCLVKLQQEHRSIVGEVTAHYEERVTQEVLLEGLKATCQSRCESLEMAEAACDHSAVLSVHTKKQLDAVLAQCQQHVARITSQEFARCGRVGAKTVRNCAMWYRCIGDLLSIRASRLDKLNTRSEEGGWHAQFLQKQELDAQSSAVGELDAVRRKIETSFLPLSRKVLALDVACPTLKFVDAQDPETLRMRRVFLHLPDAGRERLIRESVKELQQQQQQSPSLGNSRNDSISSSVGYTPPRATVPARNNMAVQEVESSRVAASGSTKLSASMAGTTLPALLGASSRSPSSARATDSNAPVSGPPSTTVAAPPSFAPEPPPRRRPPM